ncbi:LLM class flavin-dependent oxidoreductase [Sulfitobacter sp. 20_GPM-1509m]|uniref:LLM class flavin-dependent oxidoreductase n=1 Tax=Sulfitobacter sp. 20_GPM-1509m TaxID=1380367 RepID=UPI00048F309E|nr:LLM class flavin-dependent oxidoreductase [Sulfitobacter sp. 20_GPM-1509m]|tara:strand:- start:5445 stop:6524 length:1080 start_codon:yes stop_codon:yes gene_type:complete
MEFGVFTLAQQRSYNQSSQEVIANTVEQTVLAEQAGFDAAWSAEHHFNNYSLSPSPLMTVAHCAGKTSKIRLGTAVCILPLYHPARFLAEVGYVDTVSNGRLELGIGSGYQQFEFERFGTSLADAGPMFQEYLDVIPMALTQQSFEYHGKYLDIPPSSISVRCVQDPMPPIWVTTGNPKVRERAMKEGHNLFVTVLHGDLDAIQGLRTKLEESASEAGTDIADTKLGFLRCGFASDNKAEIESYLDSARFARRLSESLKDRRQQTDDGYLMQEVPLNKEMSLDEMAANLPVGSVNQVIDRMLAEIEILKPHHIALQTQLGDFDQKTMLKQIELWGDKIIPAINKALGQDTVAPAKVVNG